jgi:hypothetical protein
VGDSIPAALSGPWLKPRPGSGENGRAPRSTQKKVSKTAPSPAAGDALVFVIVVVMVRKMSVPAAVVSHDGLPGSERAGTVIVAEPPWDPAFET